MLIDTDVLIDVALDRKPHSEAACELLDRLERRPGSAFIAWHTAANFYYLVASKRGSADTRRFLSELLGYVGVAPVDTAVLRFATTLPMSDFEDAMQVAAARACKAHQIVTRNVRDYRLSPIPAITPREAVSGVR
ncbi:MAG: PIN domain-containing protein [Acidobacteriia bacterium]|nr:PIN domain-containing protein [Terriglobia bacterium]MYG03563.1 PIN domain-containing protein [Terriglobia bacterium]MYK11936.1 PIN domain-containing protein [Terriglobia bacterium]